MGDETVSRDDAIRMAREDRARTTELLGRLAPDARSEPGLGGGDWSPSDLVGHLESWEEHALSSLDAWQRDEIAPLEKGPWDTDGLNRSEVERKAGRSADEMWGAAAATHERMLEAFAAIDDERWAAPARSGDERSLGERLGSILGGDLGLFRHDPDHWRDLEAFAEQHPG